MALVLGDGKVSAVAERCNELSTSRNVLRSCTRDAVFFVKLFELLKGLNSGSSLKFIVIAYLRSIVRRELGLNQTLRKEKRFAVIGRRCQGMSRVPNWRLLFRRFF